MFGAGKGKKGEEEEEESGATADPEAECKAEFQPVVQLEDVATTTGEEKEEKLFESKAKLYRFIPDKEEWKERGTGVVRLLKAEEDGKIRCLMRRNRTLKICANFYIVPGITLSDKPGSDTTLMWTCYDFADEEQKMEMFAMRFPTKEEKDSFRSTFEQSVEDMAKIVNPNSNEQSQSKDDEEKGTHSQADSTKKDPLQQKAAVDEVTSKVASTNVSSPE